MASKSMTPSPVVSPKSIASLPLTPPLHSTPPSPSAAAAAAAASRLSPMHETDAKSFDGHETNNSDHSNNEADGNDNKDIDDDDDDDDENPYLEDIPGRPRVPTEKRRRENAAFGLWLEQSQRESTKSSELDLAKDPLSEEIATRKIISSPREYQLELFERAKKENTIVVLDTGSGKTLISALLLRHTLEQELQHRSQAQPHKIAFFLVEKVALCFQQYDVLATNLDFPIGKIHGDMTNVMKTQEFWDQQFAENMALVCTAQIFLNLLSCSYIQINKINLLIFDEAHHTKKNHPFARIIRDYYMQEELNTRPRVLGMTASPVDAQVKDVHLAARELEEMLCSKIATVSDEVLQRSHAQRQQSEMREFYSRLDDPERSQTSLWSMIAVAASNILQLSVHLKFSKQASSTLGTWCADRYWKLLMTENEADILEARTEHEVSQGFDVSESDKAVAALQKVRRMVYEHPDESVFRDSPSLSSKVRRLHDVLEDMFRQKGAKRCIVFVQARSTAFLLDDLFRQPKMGVPGMEVGYMIGSNTGLSHIVSMSYRDQILALQRFRRGETNCLFATSVAEEGIDIPECDVIIRFDLFASAIQYIQSKGRARKQYSTYISMIEEGNVEHLRRVNQAFRDANALRRFCSALPEDRKVQDYVIDAATIAQNEKLSQKTYYIPESGARLTFINSLEVLAKFASSLPDKSHVEYIVTIVAKRFIARIIFPSTSPIKSIQGETQRSKQQARCSAAFEACVELIKKGYIDTHLQPTFAKKLPRMRNARLALKSDQKSAYEMRLKPDFWSKYIDSTSSKLLFPTHIRLGTPEALSHASRPLVLLTRHPLPQIPAIPLFFGNQQTTLVQPQVSMIPLEVAPDRLEALAYFTLRVFTDVFSKEYAAKPEDIPYMIAPFHDSQRGNAPEGEDLVDWQMVEDVNEKDELSWKDAPEDFFLVKRFAIDPWDGSRKFFLNGINKDLKPSDPTPKGVPAPKSLAYRKVEQIIKEYSNSLSLKSRQRREWVDDQPVLNAELLSTRRNFLDEFSMDVLSGGNCFVIPEPLRLSPLPVDVVSMALLLPVIMYRIDNTLIALEACSSLDLDIVPELALEAMTKDSVNTEEHGSEPVDFQAGMGKNYERLEFLGDTFLKMATTISVFTLLPTGDEFEFHVERRLMLCNKNLFNHAISDSRKLQERIRSKAFDRRAWYPVMTLTRGKAIKTKDTHCLCHKSIADVCEALIGAAYMSHMSNNLGDVSREGQDLDAAVKAVTAMVNSENHKMNAYKDYYAAFSKPIWHLNPPTAAQQYAVKQIAETIGYRFQSAPLLRSAFRHPSYTFEAVPDYQRLEFLGDGLLDMAVVDFLFQRFPQADPQWLTEHKMVMVSNHFLGCLCVKLGLHKRILLTHSALLSDIREFVTQLEHAEEAARLRSSGPLQVQQQGPKDFWRDAPQPPKALADVVEALVGAMFVDSQYDYGVVQRFFRNFMQPFFEDMSLYDTLASHHPVTALAHRLDAEWGCSRWQLHVASVPAPLASGVGVLSESSVVCALTVHERVVDHATAKSGSLAKLAVSKSAVKRFADWDMSMFQAEMGCDCGKS